MCNYLDNYDNFNGFSLHLSEKCTQKMYSFFINYLYRLINIYHYSDGALLLYYNKDETEFLAPKFKIS
jgi:hypothetical protein